MNYFRCGGGRSTHTATKIDVAKTPIATFKSNVSGLYIPEILAYIQATQAGSGDPSSINPRAINGVSEVKTTRTGKNVAVLNNLNKPSWYTGGWTGITLNSNDGVTQTRSYDDGGCGGFVLTLPKGTYTVSCKVANPSATYCCGVFCSYDGTTQTVLLSASTAMSTSGDRKFATFTTTAKSEIAIRPTIITFASGQTSVDLDFIQLELGSTATSYHAYTGTTATTSLGGTYYGGYLNVTTGLLTVTRWFKQSAWGDGINATDMGNNTRKLFKFESQGYNVYPPHVVEFPQLCNVATYKANFAADDVHFYCNANECILFLPENTPNDTIVQFSGELATPQTYQLTPAQIEQLLGQNNVFCSSGDVAVKYWKID